MVVAFKTKPEAVYERLRRDIIDGKLKPGQRIVISDLSKEFGFGEIPFRQAIGSIEKSQRR